jgi:hypothetical protein
MMFDFLFQAYNFRSSNCVRLLCNGQYPEVLILDPLSFEIVHSLCSQVSPDWISACCHILPPNRQGKLMKKNMVTLCITFFAYHLRC